MIDLAGLSEMNDERVRWKEAIEGAGSDKKYIHTREKICLQNIFNADIHPYRT